MNSNIQAAKTPIVDRIRADHNANQIAALARQSESVTLPLRKIEDGASMFAWINKQHGYRPVRIVGEVSAAAANTTPHLASERVFEVRYAEGPHCGQYTSFAERHLFGAIPKTFQDHMDQIELYEALHSQVVDSRREVAQAVLDRYQLGEDFCNPTYRGWDTSNPRELRCFVDAYYVDQGDVQSVKLDFRVEFDTAGAVFDAYAHDMHRQVVGRRGDSGSPH
jgi:hypothetical protein